MQAKAESDGAAKPKPKKKKKDRKPIEEALNAVLLSSPRDNEAYHDDRPTTQSDEEDEPRRESTTESPDVHAKAGVRDSPGDNQPTIDVSIKRYDEMESVLAAKRKSDAAQIKAGKRVAGASPP